MSKKLQRQKRALSRFTIISEKDWKLGKESYKNYLERKKEEEYALRDAIANR